MSNIDIGGLGNLFFAEIYQLVEKASKQNGSRMFLIGANATSINLMSQGYQPYRGTKDVDFAIHVNVFEEYNNIVEYLLQNGCIKNSNDPFTFYHTDYNVVIDLIPFGDIEFEGKVRFLNNQTELVVFGFEEVSKEVLEISANDIDNQGKPLVFRVAPLHGIFLMKVIAFGDRPEARIRDLEDLLYIVTKFFNLHPDLIYEKYFDILTEFDANDMHYAVKVGAKALAQETLRLLGNSPSPLKEAYERIFEDKLFTTIINKWQALRTIKPFLSEQQAREILLMFKPA